MRLNVHWEYVVCHREGSLRVHKFRVNAMAEITCRSDPHDFQLAISLLGLLVYVEHRTPESDQSCPSSGRPQIQSG